METIIHTPIRPAWLWLVLHNPKALDSIAEQSLKMGCGFIFFKKFVFLQEYNGRYPIQQTGG